jgi:hypothetical protein
VPSDIQCESSNEVVGESGSNEVASIIDVLPSRESNPLNGEPGTVSCFGGETAKSEMEERRDIEVSSNVSSRDIKLSSTSMSSSTASRRDREIFAVPLALFPALKGSGDNSFAVEEEALVPVFEGVSDECLLTD